MTDQLALVFDKDMAARFEELHQTNPIVYVTLVRLAHEWVKSTGRHKLGIGALYERARWDIALATKNPDCKLNNNFRAFYARLIMRECPDLADLFDLRASAADQWILTREAS